MVARSIAQTVAEYLRALSEQGLDPAFGVLFGSHARGNPHEWSDIDLVVVSHVFDLGVKRSFIDLMWRIAARVDSRIEPVACGLEEWSQDNSRAIIEIARREGKIIRVEEASQNKG